MLCVHDVIESNNLLRKVLLLLPAPFFILPSYGGRKLGTEYVCPLSHIAQLKAG